MKRTILLFAMIAMSYAVLAQEANQKSSKKIEVTGKAEMEIIPDEIYVSIALKEYKNGTKLIDINTLEAGLVKAVNQLGIKKENLTVDNVYGYNWDWRKKKSDEFLATKSFKLKVSDVKMLNGLVSKLDSEGLNSMSIANVTHSKIDEYKMQLKIEALKAAKEKATVLLGAIGEEIGGAISISEIDYGGGPMYERNTMMMMDAKVSNYQSELEYKNITISAEINAVFEIK